MIFVLLCKKYFDEGGAGQSLWQMLRKTAPPLACKKGDFKRVIKEAVKNHADKIK